MTSRNRWRNGPSMHAHEPSKIYLHFMRLNWLISRSDSGSGLRQRMTGGNHIGHRYNQIQGRPLMPCVQTKLDHVLLHNTGGQLIPSLLQLIFPLKVDTQITTIFIKKYVWMCVFFFFFSIIEVAMIPAGHIYILPYSISWLLIDAALWHWETTHHSWILSVKEHKFRFSEWTLGTDWVWLDRCIAITTFQFLQLHFLPHNWMVNSLAQIPNTSTVMMSTCWFWINI